MHTRRGAARHGLDTACARWFRALETSTHMYTTHGTHTTDCLGPTHGQHALICSGPEATADCRDGVLVVTRASATARTEAVLDEDMRHGAHATRAAPTRCRGDHHKHHVACEHAHVLQRSSPAGSSMNHGMNHTQSELEGERLGRSSSNLNATQVVTRPSGAPRPRRRHPRRSRVYPFITDPSFLRLLCFTAH